MPDDRRPTLFSAELADEICERVSRGETIAAICREDDKPNRRTIHRWMCSLPEFAEQLERAIELRADHWVDEIISISDNRSDDLDLVESDSETGAPRWVVNSAKIQRDRLKVDTRKWAACKLYRRRYGDHVVQEHTGKDGGPIQSQQTIDRTPRLTREQWLINAANDLQRPELAAGVDDVEGDE